MTGRQVALIRGINVGKAKRVAMAELRAAVEALGYGEVRTLLNSGNVVFTTPGVVPGEAAARIEEAIAGLGVRARVTVLTAAELAEIVAGNPLGEIADNPSSLLVAVLASPADRAKLAPIEAKDWAPEVLAVGKRAAYIWCAQGILGGKLFEAVDRALGNGVTSRNWATVMKLHALAGGEGS